MSESDGFYTQVQSLLQMLVGGFARHLFTALAGSLVTRGVLMPMDTDRFVELGMGVMLGGVALAWSAVQKASTRSALVEAVNAPQADVPVK